MDEFGEWVERCGSPTGPAQEQAQTAAQKQASTAIASTAEPHGNDIIRAGAAGENAAEQGAGQQQQAERELREQQGQPADLPAAEAGALWQQLAAPAVPVQRLSVYELAVLRGQNWWKTTRFFEIAPMEISTKSSAFSLDIYLKSILLSDGSGCWGRAAQTRGVISTIKQLVLVGAAAQAAFGRPLTPEVLKNEPLLMKLALQGRQLMPGCVLGLAFQPFDSPQPEVHWALDIVVVGTQKATWFDNTQIELQVCQDPATTTAKFGTLRQAEAHHATFGSSSTKNRDSALRAMMHALCDTSTGVHWGVARKPSFAPLGTSVDVGGLTWQPVTPRPVSFSG